MDISWQVSPFSWEFEPGIVLILAALGGLYGRGWWWLRRRAHRAQASGWRLVLFVGGLGALAVALLSPIRSLETRLFSIHMLQHELLIEIAPSLIWLGNPLLYLFAGMPRPLGRVLARRGLGRRAWPRRQLRRWLSPRGVLVLYLGTVTLWHVPPIYDYALRRPWAHGLEHLSLVSSALLFWWYVTGAPPRLLRTAGYQLPLGYVLAAYAQNEVLGVGLTLIQQPLYASHLNVTRPWGLSALADQMIGGAIMWIPGELIYAGTMMALLMRLLDEGEPVRGVFELYSTEE